MASDPPAVIISPMTPALLPHPVTGEPFRVAGAAGDGLAGRPGRRRNAGGPHGLDVDRLAGAGAVGCRAGRARLGVPGLPSAGRVARGLSRPKASGPRSPTSRTGGGPGPGFGDLRAAGAGGRARPGGQRHQPHRPDVHRRPQRRLDLRCAAPRRLRKPALELASRRRPAAHWRAHRRGGALRASGQQAHPAERETCGAWLDRDLALAAPTLRSMLALGAFGWGAALAQCRPAALGGAPAQAEVRPRRGGQC